MAPQITLLDSPLRITPMSVQYDSTQYNYDEEHNRFSDSSNEITELEIEEEAAKAEAMATEYFAAKWMKDHIELLPADVKAWAEESKEGRVAKPEHSQMRTVTYIVTEDFAKDNDWIFSANDVRHLIIGVEGKAWSTRAGASQSYSATINSMVARGYIEPIPGGKIKSTDKASGNGGHLINTYRFIKSIKQ